MGSSSILPVVDEGDDEDNTVVVLRHSGCLLLFSSMITLRSMEVLVVNCGFWICGESSPIKSIQLYERLFVVVVAGVVAGVAGVVVLLLLAIRDDKLLFPTVGRTRTTEKKQKTRKKWCVLTRSSSRRRSCVRAGCWCKTYFVVPKLNQYDVRRSTYNCYGSRELLRPVLFYWHDSTVVCVSVTWRRKYY